MFLHRCARLPRCRYSPDTSPIRAVAILPPVPRGGGADIPPPGMAGAAVSHRLSLSLPRSRLTHGKKKTREKKREQQDRKTFNLLKSRTCLKMLTIVKTTAPSSLCALRSVRDETQTRVRGVVAQTER